MKKYSELPTLVGLVLEDSYVMNIVDSPTRLHFELIAAVGPKHPRYSPPLPNEHHCYVNGNLIFNDAREKTWLQKTDVEYTDPEGDPDRGSIDSLLWEDMQYYIAGPWGEVSLEAGEPPVFVTAE